MEIRVRSVLRKVSSDESLEATGEELDSFVSIKKSPQGVLQLF